MRKLILAAAVLIVGACTNAPVPVQAQIASACNTAAIWATRTEPKVATMTAAEVNRAIIALDTVDEFCAPGATPPATGAVLSSIIRATAEMKELAQ